MAWWPGGQFIQLPAVGSQVGRRDRLMSVLGMCSLGLTSQEVLGLAIVRGGSVGRRMAQSSPQGGLWEEPPKADREEIRTGMVQGRDSLTFYGIEALGPY